MSEPVFSSRLGEVAKGTVVTCESGHAICTVAKTIKGGDVVGTDCFSDWQQTPPHDGTPFEKCLCEKCGARWVGYVEVPETPQWYPGLHTDLGWVTSRGFGKLVED